MSKMFYSLVTLILAFSLSSHAQVDPSIHWKTMRLPHFDLIYDAHHQELANIYASRLEAAFENLTPLFPADTARTSVVLDDRTDLTNGSASVFPYPVILAYPVLPAPQESIGEYNDWAAELVTHEFTHILAMHPQRGNVGWLSYIFGSIMSPNILLPRWWHEGLAVEMETRFSSAGRLRSAQQDAWLRSFALDDHWSDIKISDANEITIPTWPYGARPYVMGSALWSELIDLKGVKIANDLAWAHGGRLPYLINSPAEDLIGMDYSDLFDQMQKNLHERILNQIANLKKLPPSKTENLGFTTLDVNSPNISPDGLKMAVSGKDTDSGRRRILVMKRASLNVDFDSSQFQGLVDSNPNEINTEMKNPLPHEQDLGEDGPHANSRLSWMPDSVRMVYDSVDELNWYHDVSDLYIYNINDKKVERLSTGLRAREPAVSPDGKMIAFIRVMAGKTEMGSFDIATKKEGQVLVSSPLQGRCSYPSFIDSHNIVFSYRATGKESLEVLDLRTHQLHRILPEFPNANFPTVVNGQLIFTSTLNGVHNLYVANKSLTSAKPVTHSLSAVYQSTWDWSQKKYYLTEQTANGLQVSRLLASNSEALPAQLPVVPPLYNDRYPKDPGYLKTVGDLAVATSAPVEDFSSWKYILPRYWLPLYSWDSFSSYLTASTSGGDPLGKHAWSADGIYDLGFGRTSYILGYANTQTVAQMLATVSDITVTLPGLIPSRSVFDNVEANWEITSISPYLQAGFGWTKLNRIIFGGITQQSGPTLQAAYSNFTQSGAQISPESGFGADVTLTGFLPGPNQLNYYEAQLSLVKYWSAWLPKRHALMTKFQTFIMDQYISSNYVYTYSQALYQNTALPQYLMRAYPSGTFQGRVLNNLTLEYRFPLMRLYHGSGTTPLYFKQIHAALTADGVSVDGAAFNYNTNNYQVIGLSQTFWSLGAEARFDTTIGYQFPMTFYVGVYMPTTTTLSNGGNYAAGIYF